MYRLISFSLIFAATSASAATPNSFDLNLLFKTCSPTTVQPSDFTTITNARNATIAATIKYNQDSFQHKPLADDKAALDGKDLDYWNLMGAYEADLAGCIQTNLASKNLSLGTADLANYSRIVKKYLEGSRAKIQAIGRKIDVYAVNRKSPDPQLASYVKQWTELEAQLGAAAVVGEALVSYQSTDSVSFLDRLASTVAYNKDFYSHQGVQPVDPPESKPVWSSAAAPE